MSFLGSIHELVTRIGPGFLKGPNIGRFLEAVALTFDNEIGSLDQGLKLSQPLNCDASALPVLSRDRQIRLFASEPEQSKRVRLAQWRRLHRQRGTHIGQLRHVAPFFFPDAPVMRIVHQDGLGQRATWHNLDGAGNYTITKIEPSNWDYDGLTSHWSRYWVIVYPPTALFTAYRYDSGIAYDDVAIYDGIVTQVARDIVDMFVEWGGPDMRLGAVIFATDPASFDPHSAAMHDSAGWTTLPVGNWGSPISPPPTSVMTRLPSAIWVYEGAP